MPSGVGAHTIQSAPGIPRGRPTIRSADASWSCASAYRSVKVLCIDAEDGIYRLRHVRLLTSYLHRKWTILAGMFPTLHR